MTDLADYGLQTIQELLHERIASYARHDANLAKIDLKAKQIVPGKIELDVILQGFVLMSRAMATELRLCFNILDHLEVGLSLLKEGKLAEYEAKMPVLWAAVEQTRRETDVLAKSALQLGETK